MSEIAVTIKNLSKVYRLYNHHIDRLKEALNPLKKKYHREFYALKNINLEVKKGEILGVMGRNGAGKSTLVKIISGLLTETTGNCQINGDVSALLSLGTSFNAELTGMENIYLHGTLQGYSKKEMDEMLDNIVSFAEIGNFIHQPLKTYSSGMRSRLGFAMEIHMEPEILILDEVLSVGDELFRRKCFAKMEEIFKSGCTIFFVSHSAGAINEICSRAILLDKGEKIMEGEPKTVTMYYQKMLYSKPWEVKQVRNEIIALGSGTGKDKEIPPPDMETPKALPTEDEPRPTTPAPTSGQKPFFIKNLEPKTRMEQRNYDVRIKDVHFRTTEGERVNALVMGETYVFSYAVQFNENAGNVVFSIAIRTEKGRTVSSSKTGIGNKKVGNIIEKIKKGERWLMEWEFECNLMAGNYYTNIGIRSFPDGDDSFILSRIVDAAVFKVQAIPNLTHGGICRLVRDVQVTCVNP